MDGGAGRGPGLREVLARCNRSQLQVPLLDGEEYVEVGVGLDWVR